MTSVRTAFASAIIYLPYEQRKVRCYMLLVEAVDFLRTSFSRIDNGTRRR